MGEARGWGTTEADVTVLLQLLYPAARRIYSVIAGFLLLELIIIYVFGLFMKRQRNNKHRYGTGRNIDRMKNSICVSVSDLHLN